MAVRLPWRRSGADARRRTGTAGEPRWWDPTDQAFAERPILHHRDLGRGWIPVPMVNHLERLDPYGDDPASQAVRVAWTARRLTALDEGAAWRRRSDAALVVSRVEVFADEGGEGPVVAQAHRAAWREHAAPALDALWRARWHERDQAPGWIEARWVPEMDRPDALRTGGMGADAVAPDVDWLTVDDHTNAAEADAVAAYEHVTIWIGRVLVTLTVRHRHGDGIEPVVASAAVAAARRAAAFSRRSDPARGSA